MKMKLLALLLLLTTTLFGQTYDYTYTVQGTYVVGENTDNVLPGLHGDNCGQPHRYRVIVTGDLNLNNHTLKIQNADVFVMGNLIGNGRIENFCQNNQSTLFVNNVEIPLPYGTLSTTEFNPLTDYGYPYKAYDLRGALVKEGVTSDTLFFDLPKNQILLIQVKGFKMFKINLL